MKKNMTVLYIEDDAEQRRDKMYVLSSRYFKIIEADSCEEGLSLYKEHNPNMIITDIVMDETDMDGMEMVQYIREIDTKIPIFILTAYVSSTYLLQAVNLNNVYFVAKSELITNTQFEKALEKTEKFLEGDIVNSIQALSDNIYFDFLNNTIVREGKVVPLTPNESILLKLLLKYKNQTVTFETIAQVIWETSDSKSIRDSIRSLVRSLRRKLQDESISSVPTKGYKIVVK